MADSRSDLERNLNRSKVLMHIIEQALHDNDAIWQIKLGNTSYHANVSFTGRTACFSARVRGAAGDFDGAYLMLNGEPVRWNPIEDPITLRQDDAIDVDIEFSLDHHVLA